MDAQQKRDLDDLLEKKGLNHLKNKQLYSKNYNRIMGILDLPYWDDDRFSGLLVPNIWKATRENIIALLDLPYWNEQRFRYFLKPSIWGFSIPKVIEAFETYRELKLDDYILVSSLRRSKIEIITLYNYIIRTGRPLIIDGKIHFFFNISRESLLKNYGVNLDWLIEMERMNKNKL